MSWQPIGDAARDVTERLVEHPVKFGQVTYMPGAPKNAPRWIWKCACVKCERLPDLVGLHGPFRTRKAAERDCAEVLWLHHADTEGTA